MTTEEQQASEARVNGLREAITHELEANTDLTARYTDAIEEMIGVYTADPKMCAEQVMAMLFNLENKQP